MASEILLTARLKATKAFLSVSKDQAVAISMAGSAFSNVVQNIGTTYEAIVVPAEIATAGCVYFRNLDAINYVDIGLEVAAAFYAFLRLKPGEVAVGRMATNVFFAKANTAAVNLEMCLLAD